jgi:hypothetical protein
MPPPLDYATPAVSKRWSKLAIASCIASAISGPFSAQMAGLAENQRLQIVLMLGSLLIFFVAGLCALVRIRRSSGRLGGEMPAIAGMLLPGCWLLVIILFSGAIA